MNVYGLALTHVTLAGDRRSTGGGQEIPPCHTKAHLGSPTQPAVYAMLIPGYLEQVTISATALCLDLYHCAPHTCHARSLHPQMPCTPAAIVCDAEYKCNGEAVRCTL